MSDGSSPTQIGGCGIEDPIASIDSLTTIASNEDESSDCNSSYLSEQDDEPVSIVTNLRPSPLEAEEVEEKLAAGSGIAKDTGCCLYSAITALFVMAVLLGIVLIITGPALGLPFPPLMRANTPMILPPLEHNHLTTNSSDDASISHDTNHVNDHADDYQEFQPVHYDSASGDGGNHSDSFEYVDYLQEETQWQTNWTEYLANHNETGIWNGTVTEDLANLSPEALRTKYVAYVPIPLRFDDENEQTDDTDDFHDSETNDRHDDVVDHHIDDDAIYFGDEHMTPRTSTIRRRPPATVEKVLLPIVMVPESGTIGERMKTDQGSDSWRSNDFSDDRANYPPRRFDQDQYRKQADDEDHVTSSSHRIAGLNPPRRGGASGDRRRGPGLDYRMFGSFNEPEKGNRRPFRPRQRDRFRPRDDFGRTTSLHPHRVLPPQGRLRSRLNKGSRPQLIEGRDGHPSLYIRPPPKSRPRSTHPPRPRVHRPTPQDAWLSRQRTIDPPATSTKRPAYSYPRDAMSIQDIISYMTSMSHSTDQTTKKPAAAVPEHRSAVWNDYYSHNADGRSRAGQSYPSVLPPPTGISRSHDNMPVESHTRNSGIANPSNPYSFKLDVYPVRDNLDGGNSGYAQPGPAYRQQSVPPPSNYRHRPSSSYQDNRQPSGDSSGSLSGINFSYKIRYDESDRNNWSYSSYSCPSPDPYSFRPQRRPTGNGYHDHSGYTKYRENDEEDDMPVPLAFRPRRPEATTAKPKLIVHLNVFNQGKGTGSRNGYADQRQSDDEEEDYYSPSDIYRAVLRNNAPKSDHQAGGDDSIMLSGQSRVDTFAHHRMDDAGIPGDSAPSGGSSSYDNHNMAASPSDQYYTSMVTRRPSSTNTANNYRASYQSRNFYPAADDDTPELLPMPMAAKLTNSTDGMAGSSDCNGVNCVGTIPAGGVNSTLASLVIS